MGHCSPPSRGPPAGGLAPLPPPPPGPEPPPAPPMLPTPRAAAVLVGIDSVTQKHQLRLEWHTCSPDINDVGTCDDVSSREGSSSRETALASSTSMHPVPWIPDRMELTAVTYTMHVEMRECHFKKLGQAGRNSYSQDNGSEKKKRKQVELVVDENKEEKYNKKGAPTKRSLLYEKLGISIRRRGNEFSERPADKFWLQSERDMVSPLGHKLETKT
ncbi:hypothetical protein B566_EDAN006161 [Ephemera danica]|nr:hypothetical protein B566_EDAN006161 [Ephemera danica]